MGETMRIYELRQKEVINVCDGQRIGIVSDVEINMETGCVTHIIVPGPCRICGILGRDKEYVIEFGCVARVGADVILVKIDVEKVLVKCKFL